MDQDGEVLDILVQPRRNKAATIKFFRKLLKGQGCAPRQMVTDKLASYSAAKVEMMPGVMPVRDNGANNRAENSHQPTRERERRRLFCDDSSRQLKCSVFYPRFPRLATTSVQAATF